MYVLRIPGMAGYKLDGKSLTVKFAGERDPPRRTGLGYNAAGDGGAGGVDGQRGQHGYSHPQPPAPPGAPPPHMAAGE